MCSPLPVRRHVDVGREIVREYPPPLQGGIGENTQVPRVSFHRFAVSLHPWLQIFAPSERGRLGDALLAMQSERVGLVVAQKEAAEWCCSGVVGLGFGGRGIE